jgi:hypothetical protein
MNPPLSPLDAVLQEIDRVQGEDPRRILLDETSRPYEAVYAERMGTRLISLYPEASPLLQIAARAQHLRRWDLPREQYPAGRQGYEAWRRAARLHHVAVVTPILERHGFGAAEIAQVAKLIKKEELKRDPESQALENVVGVVFLEHYIGEFLEKYAALPEEKLVDILAKTLRKMSAEGHAAALALPLDPKLRELTDKAVSRLR